MAEPARVRAESNDVMLTQSRLMMVLQAFATAPADEDIPTLVISQAVSALQAAGGVVALVDGGTIEPLASRGYTRSQQTAWGPLLVGDLTLPLTWAATIGEPVWLPSQAETARRFPRIVELSPRDERAYAVLPLRAAGELLGVMGISWTQPHAFELSDRELLLALADICALHLQQWRKPQGDGDASGEASAGRMPSSAVALAPLAQALTGSDTLEELARAVAEHAASAVGAAFSNMAVLDSGPSGDLARVYHLSSLSPQIAQRYRTLHVDGSTPLGAAMTGRGDVWLEDLAQMGAQFPLIVADTSAAGLASTASLPLTARGRVLGALGLGWDTPQAFSASRREPLRVVAKLVADALARTQMLTAERVALERAQRLHGTLSALVASSSLDQVVEALFAEGTAPYDAAAARLALTDEHNPETLVTTAAVGLPEGLDAVWQPTAGTGLSPLSDARTSRTTVYLPALDDLLRTNPETHAPLSRAGLRSWVGLPLRTGSRTLGTLLLAFPQENALRTTDLTALSDLGSAVSEAVSRAVEHDRDHDLAVLVQRSLLAEPLPALSHVQVSARYLPADARYGIGGDWYDVIPLAEGRTLLMIGDVAGHHAGAALTMAQVRSAARALAPTYEPARLLEELDRFVTGSSPDLMVTTAAVLVDPREATLTYSLAGHPPPVLRRPGAPAAPLDAQPDPPLGLSAASRSQHTVELASATTLVLYTDGLIEPRSEPITAGLRRLAAAVDQGPVDDPERLCASLLDTCLRDVRRRDDTALICAVITVPGPRADVPLR